MAEKNQKSFAHAVRDFTALLNWLKGQGFEITQTSPDFTGIYAKGTVGQIGKSLGVEMRQITYKGKTMPAATTPSGAAAPCEPGNRGDLNGRRFGFRH